MKFYIDGFTIGSNPSPQGGGFTVMDEDNNLIEQKTFFKPKFTNNEAEVLGIAKAASLAEMYDTIFTDSECARIWAISGFSKARPDLGELLLELRTVVAKKQLEIIWIPRHLNLAGIFNERPKTFKF